jgi:glycerol-3-phosphate dehydrogenase
MAATQDEAAYLLKYVNKYLNSAFTFSDVRAAFVGARPLVASTGSADTNVDTKKLIRDHEVETDEQSGLISILGGKWTTYRAMAEDGIDRVMRALGDERTRAKTLGFLLTGSRQYSAGYWKELSERYSLSAETARHLARKFGTDAPRVLEVVNSESGLDKPLYPGAAALTGEVLYCIREEMAQTIEDVLARRIGIQFHSWKDAIAAAPAVGRLLGRELGWSELATMRAIESYIDAIAHLARLAAVSLDFQASSAAKPN